MKEITILIGVSTAIGRAVSMVGMALVPSLIDTPSGVHLEVLPGVDPPTLLAVVVVMAAKAVAAAYFPARRAANADPSISLRHE
jgi:ABC-type antimicrobial peptide transport system permease subunit